MSTLSIWAGSLTVKPLLYAVAILALLVLVLGGCLYVQGNRHDTTVAKLEQQADGWRKDYGVAASKAAELEAANKGWQDTTAAVQAQLAAEQQQCADLSRQGDKAVAAAQAKAADADRTLKSFVDRYAQSVRAPDCAAALNALEGACPLIRAY